MQTNVLNVLSQDSQCYKLCFFTQFCSYQNRSALIFVSGVCNILSLTSWIWFFSKHLVRSKLKNFVEKTWRFQTSFEGLSAHSCRYKFCNHGVNGEKMKRQRNHHQKWMWIIQLVSQEAEVGHWVIKILNPPLLLQQKNFTSCWHILSLWPCLKIILIWSKKC